MSKKNDSYGIQSQIGVSTENDQLLEKLRWNGFAVIPSVLSEAALVEARNRIDAVYEKQLEEFGEEKLNAISELNLARMPLLYDEWFISLAVTEKVIEVATAFLGDYFILHVQNGILNQPSKTHHQSKWHRDLPYQQWTSSKPLAMGAMFCIDDFTIKSGGTVMLPHSHRFDDFPSDQYSEEHEITAEAPAGSIVIFDAMTFHRAGANKSGKIRRGINHLYTIPLIKQQIDLPEALGEETEIDQSTRRILGYESRTRKNVADWRHRHD